MWPIWAVAAIWTAELAAAGLVAGAVGARRAARWLGRQAQVARARRELSDVRLDRFVTECERESEGRT